jgi:hypothetical protein
MTPEPNLPNHVFAMHFNVIIFTTGYPNRAVPFGVSGQNMCICEMFHTWLPHPPPFYHPKTGRSKILSAPDDYNTESYA